MPFPRDTDAARARSRKVGGGSPARRRNAERRAEGHGVTGAVRVGKVPSDRRGKPRRGGRARTEGSSGAEEG
ncbi:MAG: hypothetical protein BLITH_0937 [Brockia lithotrophica]|uniref:Uncharacterized protein n=1 Tax=Brockia lithotrophica TaxID=933949 RepID=A0A2T5G704_9BACL|nr:MAG: hypothetical protein BLITH_0937 [Brockia lithotrophica]